jgi:hypothetical protein
MKHAVEMGSGAMINIPSFITSGSAFKSWEGWGIHRHTGNMVISYTYFFFKIRKVG